MRYPSNLNHEQRTAVQRRFEHQKTETTVFRPTHGASYNLAVSPHQWTFLVALETHWIIVFNRCAFTSGVVDTASVKITVVHCRSECALSNVNVLFVAVVLASGRKAHGEGRS